MPELDRRDFLKLVGAGAGAAATSGCSDHVTKLIPYVVQPEVITPGIPVFYASTCRECPAACGLHVKTREGRPIKLEGNPEHPVNRGALCARGQAGIGRTYHPDRFRGPMLREAGGELRPITWDEARKLLAQRLRAAGKGARVLGASVGPTLDGLIDRWTEAVGAGGRTVYEPFAYESLREASRAVFGVAGLPVFDLEQADLVLDFGADSLVTWLSPTEHARQLAAARSVTEHHGGGARLVAITPRLSLTASNADEWMPARPGTEGLLALALAKRVLELSPSRAQGLGGLDVARRTLAAFDAKPVPDRAGVSPDTLERLARALAASRAPVALPPGVALTGRRATATAGAVLLLNAVVGAVGTRVQISAEAPTSVRRASMREIQQLIGEMNSGAVRLLLVHDANPVYSLPAGAGFAAALDKVDFVVSFASIADETSARADLILPDHTPLESWGDAEPRRGVRSLVQPTVRPLYDTQSLGDTLLDTARLMGDAVASRLPAGSFRSVLETAWSGTDFAQALARGGSFETGAAGGAVTLAAGVATLDFGEAPLEGDGDYTLVTYPSPLLYDGRGANLPWLQETPDPVTKIAWQSWVEMSRDTAAKLGVGLGDVVSVETPYGRVESPVLPRGGIQDDVIALPIGQGHTVGTWASREGAARGASALALLPAATDETGGRAWLTVKARVSPTGRYERVALVQKSDNKRGRLLGETVSLAELAQAGAGAGHGEGEHGNGQGEHHELLVPFDAADDAVEDSPYRWGMSIDLDRCTGCSACVVACYVENNVPVVGEVGTLHDRQMPWIRIERFVGDGEPTLEGGRPAHRDREELGDTDIRHSVMLCQQCGAAPCESVCPVFATSHTDEGLNGMIYNRCIGTRYCSNNCPYKVRRFNFFDYQIENWPEPMRLMLNPDVTVRAQGVMEKCTFCVQRIESARQAAKDEKRPIGDGEVQTACQQACPTQAIAFGNLRDPNSRVAKAADQPARSYHALHELNTRPAVTYLSRVRRGRVEG